MDELTLEAEQLGIEVPFVVYLSVCLSPFLSGTAWTLTHICLVNPPFSFHPLDPHLHNFSL